MNFSITKITIANSINLSILDFKSLEANKTYVIIYPINLSILDFKSYAEVTGNYERENYKSIHIGF